MKLEIDVTPENAVDVLAALELCEWHDVDEVMLQAFRYSRDRSYAIQDAAYWILTGEFLNA